MVGVAFDSRMDRLRLLKAVINKILFYEKDSTLEHEKREYVRLAKVLIDSISEDF